MESIRMAMIQISASLLAGHSFVSDTTEFDEVWIKGTS
jgi:hypothetical protein